MMRKFEGTGSYQYLPYTVSFSWTVPLELLPGNANLEQKTLEGMSHKKSFDKYWYTYIFVYI